MSQIVKAAQAMPIAHDSWIGVGLYAMTAPDRRERVGGVVLSIGKREAMWSHHGPAGAKYLAEGWSDYGREAMLAVQYAHAGHALRQAGAAAVRPGRTAPGE